MSGGGAPRVIFPGTSHAKQRSVNQVRLSQTIPRGVTPLICESDYARPRTALSFTERRDCISDEMGLGRLRAFDAFHKNHHIELERDFEKRWAEQERLRIWKSNQMQGKIMVKSKEKDRGILESIVNQRNSERKLLPAHERDSVKIGRKPLPKEDRAIYNISSRRIFFWG